ncbi:MAG: AMP-binding protein [Eubacteriales bacterium]|nr:AMP-binding protein [Eubacteriales bacterium]
MDLNFLNEIPYICDRWEELVRQKPEAILLTEETGDRSCTRLQAEELSARVYAWLAGKGIGREDFVLIRLPRSAAALLCMLGVWKAGAAFTAVEDDYAPERIESIRKDCGCRLVIDEAAFKEILATEPLSGFRRADDHDACFAIYTSGSTGRPKGVLQEYGKIRLNQASMERHPGDLCAEGDCIALTPPLNFIAAVKIWLNTLYAGMRTVLLSKDTVRNPEEIIRLYDRYQVNHTFLTPTILRVMKGHALTSLKTLITGGEAANGLYFDGVRLINNYGMSEAGFHVAQFPVDRRYDVVPIGRPVREEIRIRLLDEEDHDVADGEEGEICFENPFFRGYIQREEETAQAVRNGLFHSGDKGKLLPDGNYVVTGRLNTMVKINGNRVEPNEICIAMREIPGIEDAAVRDFQNDRQQTFLCAYYTGAEEYAADELRKQLGRNLPSYMIPAFFVHMDSLPLNQNGKVDRFALPRPKPGQEHRPYAAPRTPDERRICEAYEKVLGISPVGINDDFFSLGGDSVSTAILAAELEDLQVDYKDVYACRTPAALAIRVSEKEDADLDELNRMAMQRDQELLPFQVYYFDVSLANARKTCANNFSKVTFSREAVDPARLKEALETVFCHYSIFNSVFVFNEDCSLVMRYLPERYQRVQIHEIGEYTDEITDRFLQPFRMVNELMYRCEIYATPTQTILLFDSHHAISDGTMMANFAHELFAAYRGEALRADHYFYFLERQRRVRMTLAQEADISELLERFRPADARCNPPADYSGRTPDRGDYAGRTTVTIGACLKACERLNTSMNQLFVAAGLVALSGYEGAGKVSVRRTFNGRDEQWEKDLMGIAISSIPVTVDMRKIHTPGQLMQEIASQSEQGMHFMDCSLGNLGAALGERDCLNISYESGFSAASSFPEGTRIETAYARMTGANTRFAVILNDHTAQPQELVTYDLVYNRGVYAPESAERFGEMYDRALKWMTEFS